MWIQVPVGSLGCLEQGIFCRNAGFVEGSALGWRVHLEEPFFGTAFSVLTFLFSYSTDLWSVHLCKVLLLCVHIASELSILQLNEANDVTRKIIFLRLNYK